MAKKHSFESMIWEHYAVDIEKAVAEYINEGFTDHELSSRNMWCEDGVILAQFSLHSVVAYDSLSETLDFDVTVIADTEIRQQSNGTATNDDEHIWLNVSCSVEVCDGFKKFRINSITAYDANNISTRKKLTDTLVPHIHTIDLAYAKPSNETPNIARTLAAESDANGKTAKTVIIAVALLLAGGIPALIFIRRRSAVR